MSTFTLFTPDEFQQYAVHDQVMVVEQMYPRIREYVPDDPAIAAPTFQEFNHALQPGLTSGTYRYQLTQRYRNSHLQMAHYSRERTNPVLRATTVRDTLPLAVRYIDTDGTQFIERYPFQITVEYADSNRKTYIKKSDNIQIWIPWTITRFKRQTLTFELFYRSRSLSSMDDRFFIGAMPNSYASGALCWGYSLNQNSELNFDPNSGEVLNPSDKNVFTLLFNEYFSGGWNTDLGSNLYLFLCRAQVIVGHKSEQYPMISRMLRPDPDRISERFRHLSAPRRRLLSGGLASVGQNRLKQGAYILYMLSDFNLTETLAFYEEMESISENQAMFTTMSELLSRNNVNPGHDLADPRFRYQNLMRPVSNPQLPSQPLDGELQELFVHYYNFAANLEWPAYRTSIYALVQHLQNLVFINFLKHYAHDSVNKYIYFVDVRNQSYHVQVITPELLTETKGYNLDFKISYLALREQHRVMSASATGATYG